MLVKGNDVHDMNRLCLYVDAWDSPTYNITLDSNRAQNRFRLWHRVGVGAGGELYNVSIINNVMYRNVRNGITIGDWDAGDPHPIHDIAIINNTAYDNGDGVWGGGIEVMETVVAAHHHPQQHRQPERFFHYSGRGRTGQRIDR